MRRKPRAKSPKKNLKSAKKIKKVLKKPKKGLTSPKPRAKQPASPMPGSQEFKALQATWYARLKSEGFQDLERASDQDALLSTRGAQPAAKFAEAALLGRELYFRRLTNFITHNTNWSGDRLSNFVALLYVEGYSYRRMLPVVATRLDIQTNIWRVHKIIKQLENRSNVWNKINPEGIDFQADFNPSVKL